MKHLSPMYPLGEETKKRNKGVKKVLLKNATEGDGTPKFNALLTKLYYVGQRRKHRVTFVVQRVL